MFVPKGFSEFFICFLKFSCIIPIVLHKFQSPIKKSKNLDVNKLLELSLNKKEMLKNKSFNFLYKELN